MAIDPTSEDAALARIGDRPLVLRRTRRDVPTPRRQALEAFIGARFAEHHAARIRHFMPDLLALEELDGRLRAAIGVRDAQHGPLFLERYLDRPVEVELMLRHGVSVPRARIAEVGNLAALGAGHARLLIVALTDLLVSEGFEWVVFTATTEVSNSFRRLALAPLVLGRADPARMGDERADWGSYYDCNPLLMAGAIRGGYETLAARGAFQRIGHRALYPAVEGGCHAAVA